MNKIVCSALCICALFAGCHKGEKGAPRPEFDNEVDTISYQLGMAMSPDKEDVKRELMSPMTGSDSIYMEEYIEGVRDGLLSADDKKKCAYVAGIMQGFRMGQSCMAGDREIFDDSLQHINRKNVLAGFVNGVNGERTALKIDGKPMDKKDAQRDLQERLVRIQRANLEKKFGANKKKGEDFIAKKAKTEGVQKLEGGTLYTILTEGTGEHVQAGDMVNVVYEGRLIDGTVFDSSSKHSDQPIPMRVGSAIPGFDAALLAMPVGSEWEIYIPADQAYGANPNIPEIPAFSALVFKVKLVGPYNEQ